MLIFLSNFYISLAIRNRSFGLLTLKYESSKDAKATDETGNNVEGSVASGTSRYFSDDFGLIHLIALDLNDSRFRFSPVFCISCRTIELFA